MTDLTPGSEVPLAEVLSDPLAASVSPEEIVSTDPFGNSKSFAVDKEINVAQLQEEIEQASGATVALSLHRIPGQTAGTLYLSPGEAVDGRTVVGKIKSHVPDPLFGLTEEQRLQAEVMAKVRRGKPLDPEELTVALRALAKG
jgi:hypothetical protein